jgi:hypothetical protein
MNALLPVEPLGRFSDSFRTIDSYDSYDGYGSNTAIAGNGARGV